MALIIAHAQSAISKSRDALRKALQAVRSTLTVEANAIYRPELHYMRGPGPKSREAREHSTLGAPSRRPPRPRHKNNA